LWRPESVPRGPWGTPIRLIDRKISGVKIVRSVKATVPPNLVELGYGGCLHAPILALRNAEVHESFLTVQYIRVSSHVKRVIK
jgi:hypothetical protein